MVRQVMLQVSAVLFLTLLSACSGHQEQQLNETGEALDHSMHQQMMQMPHTGKSSDHAYKIPDVTLLNQDREAVRLSRFLRTEKPLLLQFVYASCTTICPVLSAGFANLQDRLLEKGAEAQLVSITIDPEHDNPEVMKHYLENFEAAPNWDFLTGSRRNIDAVLHAFNAYVSNKMSHKPLTFIKVPGTDRWRRLDGLMSGKQLYSELQALYPAVLAN